MDKQLLQKINRAIEHKIDGFDQCTVKDLMARIKEELDWIDADPIRLACTRLLSDVAAKVRTAGIVTSPGFGYFNCSLLLYLTGVTRVNPVLWDLPFSFFLEYFGPNNDLVLETGTGGVAVAEKVLEDRDEIIAETEPGTFQITFTEVIPEMTFQLHVIENEDLDKFKRTLKGGWRPLTEKVLYKFNLGLTDGSVWFETDKMRGWLSDFEPESMSDLCLLRALNSPRRIHLYREVLCRKQNPGSIPSTGNPRVDRILQETYGILVYKEQAHLLQKMGATVPEHDYILALKGEEIARTMLSVEALWPKSRP
ncbi:MAG: hypothetical protein IK103_05010 [Bacteroidales bacterium]|nr:hypothetical protein [Bacteroidales bacterium]